MKNIRYPFQYFLITLVLCCTGIFPIHSQSTGDHDSLWITSIRARSHGCTPLMVACQAHSIKQIKLLLVKGTKINEVDSAGNNALMYAAISQTPRVAKLLLRWGASLNARNNDGLTAYRIAIHFNNRPMVTYLRHMFESHLPEYFDGPYAVYQGKQKIELSYIKHDSLKKRTGKYTAVYNLKKTKGWVRGFAGDTASYFIKPNYQPERSTIANVDRLFVIGDIHGQCDTLKKMLINNHVTDKNLRWCFGNGHVVFLGDIFDRGESVTEALWLIYRLEYEAKLAGGGAHLILGNHEMMVLSGDMRNFSEISDKYYFLFNNLKLDYDKYYNNKTVLGRWLNSKNTLLKINGLLFVHGGIHPELLNYGVSIDSVNHTIHHYLTGKQKRKGHTRLLNFLLGIDGPFWYRGMISRETINDPITEADVNHILSYYNVNAVMVGHTLLPRITAFMSDKVYGLDVPFYLCPGKPMEALYIEKSIYYRVFSNGLKVKMNK